ncbi:PLP-dependent aminotransferase family protein [Micromonospora tulbaghiae]|uniref:DNA-binding transcriptional regulator, MocR family, contains an aminotransferase domain n=1 Tax=Micromonospora tulbaghiae TaxID=479978 RepID=A0AAW4JKU6_9ACTN|nr:MULTISPECIES: PLP-dependent aminotransferase family protein [Micromonospora]KAB1909709.1 PLP-dependent aminotransferase family protein [Micromonospora sp. AMSO1212t]MBO4139411.1 PLP-dependent aminotransferase family protein [Micromonospora tulbaghiae]MDX5456954.1 PLP-dependent aminotransferase family protein [Micromonospora tulbaghiae]SCE63486.1 DNA-binding transcriptional regulator, MocR family, contains an aminotransferase domain [Micromonospora tulbaghiae]
MTAEQLISFARGAPSLDIVDVEGLKAAAVRAFDADPAGVTAYGTSVGYPPLRKWIAEKHGVEADQVLITNGSLQADAFLFDHLVRRGDAVVVERPTYDRTLLNLKQMGGEVHGVTIQPDGLDTAELRKLLESGVRPRLAHVIPNYQNPAGVTLSLEKRRELLDLAAEYDFTIFEDDPYADIRFRGEPLPSMLSMDTRGVVVHASSFTKTVCPGVRVGYLVGPAELIAAIAKRATNLYISPGMVAQAIVHQFCVSGAIDESIRTVRSALGERSAVLAESLRRHIPEARFVEPDGGYFLWVELPEDVEVDRLAPAAAERGVAVVKGSDFMVDGGRHALRLAYSAVTADRIDEGVRRLAEAMAAVRG